MKRNVFLKLSDIISVKKGTKNTSIMVNNEWTFDLPNEISYETDCEFELIEDSIDLSGVVKPLVLQGISKDGSYFFDFCLERHFQPFGHYYTIDDCKYDDRYDDDTTHKIILDDGEYYVDIIIVNECLLGNDVELRVRGNTIIPFNFHTFEKNMDQEGLKQIVDLFKKIASSIKFLDKKAVKNNSGKKIANPSASNLPRLICNNEWSIEIPEGYVGSTDETINGTLQAKKTEHYKLMILKNAPNIESHFIIPYDNQVSCVVMYINDNNCKHLPSLKNDKHRLSSKYNALEYYIYNYKKVVDEDNIQVEYAFSMDDDVCSTITFLVNTLGHVYSGQFVIGTDILREDREDFVVKVLSTIRAENGITVNQKGIITSTSSEVVGKPTKVAKKTSTQKNSAKKAISKK